MASDQTEPEFLKLFKTPGNGQSGDDQPGDKQTGDGQPGDEQPGAGPGRARPGAREAWRRWRQNRPFLGGLLVVMAGAEILISEKGPLPLIIHIGVQGVAGYLIPVVLLLCGLLLLFHPVQRTFYAVLAVLLALGSWITSNLGGFFIGMLLGLVGGWLAFAWRSPEERAAGERKAGISPGPASQTGPLGQERK